jgi:hypothetical protein
MELETHNHILTPETLSKFRYASDEELDRRWLEEVTRSKLFHSDARQQREILCEAYQLDMLETQKRHVERFGRVMA